MLVIRWAFAFHLSGNLSDKSFVVYVLLFTTGPRKDWEIGSLDPKLQGVSPDLVFGVLYSTTSRSHYC